MKNTIDCLLDALNPFKKWGRLTIEGLYRIPEFEKKLLIVIRYGNFKYGVPKKFNVNFVAFDPYYVTREGYPSTVIYEEEISFKFIRSETILTREASLTQRTLLTEKPRLTQRTHLMAIEISDKVDFYSRHISCIPYFIIHPEGDYPTEFIYRS